MPTYTLHVVCTETNGAALMDSRPLTITIANANEAPYVFDVENRTVRENSAPGTYVGGRVAAFDPDADTVLTYSTVPDTTDNTVFELSSLDGQLTVLAPLDYEAQRLHQVGRMVVLPIVAPIMLFHFVAHRCTNSVVPFTLFH